MGAWGQHPPRVHGVMGAWGQHPPRVDLGGRAHPHGAVVLRLVDHPIPIGVDGVEQLLLLRTAGQGLGGEGDGSESRGHCSEEALLSCWDPHDTDGIENAGPARLC